MGSYTISYTLPGGARCDRQSRILVIICIHKYIYICIYICVRIPVHIYLRAVPVASSRLCVSAVSATRHRILPQAAKKSAPRRAGMSVCMRRRKKLPDSSKCFAYAAKEDGSEARPNTTTFPSCTRGKYKQTCASLSEGGARHLFHDVRHARIC